MFPLPQIQASDREIFTMIIELCTEGARRLNSSGGIREPVADEASPQRSSRLADIRQGQRYL